MEEGVRQPHGMLPLFSLFNLHQEGGYKFDGPFTHAFKGVLLV